MFTAVSSGREFILPPQSTDDEADQGQEVKLHVDNEAEGKLEGELQDKGKVEGGAAETEDMYSCPTKPTTKQSGPAAGKKAEESVQENVDVKLKQVS